MSGRTTKREQLIAYLEKLIERLRKDLNTISQELYAVQNMAENEKRLPKLVAAKNAACSLLRAARRNDFMLLKSDNCSEVDIVRGEAQAITQF